jgi:hypothetical protein
MRLLLTLLTAAVLSVCTTACGSADAVTDSISRVFSNATSSRITRTTPSSTSLTAYSVVDRDKDNDVQASCDDMNNNSVLSYDHAASVDDRQAVTAAIKRYYAAAAAEDDAKTCSILYWTVAEAVPEEYGRAPAPPSLRGKTCTVVMSKLFRQHHRQLAAEPATLEVTSVRIEGPRELAIFRLPTTPEPRKITLHLEDQGVAPQWNALTQ